MKISLPFVYQVDFKQPRRSNWEHADIVCRAEIELQEIDGDRAPFMHVVSDTSAPQWPAHHSGEKTKASKFHVPGGDCIIRQVDGQFYASRFPVEDIEKWRGNDEFDPFAVNVAIKHGESEFRQQITTRMASNNYRPAVPLNEFHAKNPGVKKFSSDRPLTDRYLCTLARRFAVIEGVLYEKVREPVISVVYGSPVRVYVEESISPALEKFYKGGWRGGPAGRIRFGLDEYDRAIETANALAARKGTTVEAHASVALVDVDAVRFRGDHEYLFTAAKEAANRFRKAVQYMPESTGVAVMAAANLLALHDRLTPASLAAVRRMEAELADYFANRCHPLLSVDRYAEGAWEVWSAFGDDWKERAWRFSHALEHWDARDDIGLDWLADSLDALPLYDYPKRAFEVTSQMDLDKLEMRWEGGFPAQLFRADPSSEAIVVVEDFELRQPLAALIFDRNDLAAAPVVFGNPDSTKVASEAKLAEVYVSTAKEKPTMSLAKAMVSGPDL